MRRVLSISAAVLVTVMLMPLVEAAGGQVPAASTPHFPDVLGIYIGMPAAAAKAQLQKHSGDVYVQYATPASAGFGMSIPGLPSDQLSVSITQAPNVPAVWKIERDQNLAGPEPISRNALIDVLHRKYGQENFKLTPDAGHMQLYWIFGQNGQLLSAPDPGLTQCNAVVPSAMKPETASRCNQDFFALYMAILSQGPDGDSVQSYTMVLTNLPFAAHAAQLTAGANKTAADQAQRAKDQEKNSRPVPQF